MRKANVNDFWIYRLSRHPQYLGWIIWSYGVLLLPGANMKQYVTVPNTLPWLSSTMIIIGAALLEELGMRRRYGEEYDSYRERTSFLMAALPDPESGVQSDAARSLGRLKAEQAVGYS